MVDPMIPGSQGNNSGGAGRVCLPQYEKLGYIPTSCSDAQVSRSMNYWHSVRISSVISSSNPCR